ncbi:MAG: hypothetical protein KME07_16570 [Pegethrix bostrychoides GSE-TBD4-15B]|jgi:hypothetical protein|uniref:Uncharacterized protein n=1 Tax=Pegethrix bostrychoides GSE-TBD4-15B TaxID=2839662 RepID=A0A951U5W4_9CYAN|nr:hypothetical protein [Pegethrix bostrychoides GSE-TBD4-15B]
MNNFDLQSRNRQKQKQSSSSAKRPGQIARLSALPLLTAGLAWAALPISAASASRSSRYYNPDPYRSLVADYNACAVEIAGTGVQPEAAAAACGGALYPRALSSCVTGIDGGTEILASDALSNCRRVRRPQDLATCVVGINGISTTGTEPLDVLTYCRRSLLPKRFSNCVVGIAAEAPSYSTTEMMDNCIAASNRPRQVLPSFIPRGEEVPLQPLPNSPSSGVTPTPSQILTPSQPTPAPSTPRSVPALW